MKGLETEWSVLYHMKCVSSIYSMAAMRIYTSIQIALIILYYDNYARTNYFLEIPQAIRVIDSYTAPGIRIN